MTEAHPLDWPFGWKRTKSPERSRFGKNNWKGGHTVGRARDELISELERLGATKMILSTNIPTKLDGTPYSVRIEPEDSGVAVYFTLGKEDQCIPCDKWDRVADNIWAIAKTINALRGIERWGAKDMVNAAFKGFKALPDYTEPQAKIDYFADCVDANHVKQRFKELCKELHPDVGGDLDEFQEMKRQYDVIGK